MLYDLGMAAGRPRRVTIREVALEAGVSVSTVSNWLGGRSKHMTAATEAAVAAAADRLGYRPSMAARSLRGAASQVLGIVVPSILNPSFPAIVRGAEDAAAAAGYSLFLSNIDRHGAKTTTLTRAMTDRGVDGIIYAYTVPDVSDPAVAAAREAGVGIALLTPRGADVGDLPGIALDNEAAMRQAAAHLWGLGHRRIAIATNRHLTANGPHRVDGLRAALAERGGRLDPDLVHDDTVELVGVAEGAETEVGRRAGLRLLTAAEPPTAICAVTDSIAVGVLRAARELGLRVPEDVSVVGFDDLPLARLVEPALTSFSCDLYRMGKDLAGVLLHPETAGRTVVTPSIVVRGSTGPVPAPTRR